MTLREPAGSSMASGARSQSFEKSAVVTGASAGIGRATAIALARGGYRVFAGARRVEAMGDLPGVHGTGRRIVPLRLDVTDAGSVAEFAAAVKAELGDASSGHGVPDVVVNNAGYAVSGPVEGISIEGLRRQFETNVIGLHAVTLAFVGPMRARGSGRIINVSSIVGKVAFPFQGPYCASKHAVEGLSDSLRMELSPFGVQVVLVEPGPIRTEFVNVLGENVECGPELRAVYPGVEKLGALFEKFYRSALGPEAVAEVIVRAAVARRPWARYRVPSFQIGAAVRFFAVLPTVAADAMKRGIYGHSAG